MLFCMVGPIVSHLWTNRFQNRCPSSKQYLSLMSWIEESLWKATTQHYLDNFCEGKKNIGGKAASGKETDSCTG